MKPTFLARCLTVSSLPFILTAFMTYKHQVWQRQQTPMHRNMELFEANSNEEYTNKVTEMLGLFLKKPSEGSSLYPLDLIDWDAKKRRRTSLQKLTKDLSTALKQREWFVTGNVDPSFFSESFIFEDPDVKLSGIQEYAAGVNKLFTQATSRAEIVDVSVNSTMPDTITVTWRLSGGVNIGFGLNIKPYVVYTDFTVGASDGLITAQLDRFSLPGYDILLSALFPFVIDSPLNIVAPPAPPVEELRRIYKEA